MENPTVIAKPITKAKALQELNNVLQECFDEAYTEYNERYLHEIEVDFDYNYMNDTRTVHREMCALLPIYKELKEMVEVNFD